jgi:hypothetical protein
MHAFRRLFAPIKRYRSGTSKVFSKPKSQNTSNNIKHQNLYTETKTRDSFDFNNFLTKSIHSQKIEILKKNQLRIKHNLEDKSISEKIRKNLSAQLNKSILDLDTIKKYINQIDFMAFFDDVYYQEEESYNNNNIDEEVFVENEIDDQVFKIEMVDHQTLIQESTKLLKELLKGLKNHVKIDDLKEKIDAELFREFAHSKKFFEINNLVLNIEQLELDEDSIMIKNINEYLLVDCDTKRRANGNKNNYLIKPFDSSGINIIKKKKLQKKPKTKRVTRMALTFDLKIKASIKHTPKRGPNKGDLIETEIIKEINDTLKASALFENFWVEFDHRQFMRLYKENRLDGLKTTVFRECEMLKMVDFNEVMNGNFFIK